MLVPTRRLLLIRRCARRPRAVALLVWRAPRGAGFQACGSGRPVCRTSRSRRRFVKRRPRLPLVAAGRRTTLLALAGGSRWRRLSLVASKWLCVLPVASAARRRARRAGGCAACCSYSASRPRRRRVRLTCGGRRLRALQRLQGCHLHLPERPHLAQRCRRLTKPSEAALALATMALSVDCSGRSTAMHTRTRSNNQVKCASLAKLPYPGSTTPSSACRP